MKNMLMSSSSQTVKVYRRVSHGKKRWLFGMEDEWIRMDLWESKTDLERRKGWDPSYSMFNHPIRFRYHRWDPNLWDIDGSVFKQLGNQTIPFESM